MTTIPKIPESFPGDRRGPMGFVEFISDESAYPMDMLETVSPSVPHWTHGMDLTGVRPRIPADSQEGGLSRRTKERITSGFITHELHTEIVEAQSAGYDISIGSTEDAAYDNPEKVVRVFGQLHEFGKEFTRRKAGLTAPKVGRSALGLPLPEGSGRKAARREYETTLEGFRTELLYGPVQGQAWHDQRGCATALLTITSAHELAVSNGQEHVEGAYKTMSAGLDESILDYTFQGNSLNGLSLREGMIAAGVRYRNKTRAAAAAYTDGQLQKLETFLREPVTQEFKDVVAYCTDSLGIRSRKQEVSQEIHRYADERAGRDPDFSNVLMMSIGCGTALPILEVAASLKEKGIEPKLILLDQDPIALASAAQLAQKLELEDNVEIHCERLFSKSGRPLDINKVLRGRELDIAEDSGLREYLPDRIYRALTSQIWNSLGDDGLMTTGNMNTNRPQAEFLHGLMGWTPAVQMRTIMEGARLHQQAGVPPEATRMRVTQDGVYTLYFSSKKPV